MLGQAHSCVKKGRAQVNAGSVRDGSPPFSDSRGSFQSASDHLIPSLPLRVLTFAVG